jgi:hypothetical protein
VESLGDAIVASEPPHGTISSDQALRVWPSWTIGTSLASSKSSTERKNRGSRRRHWFRVGSFTDRAHILKTGTESYRFRRTLERQKKGEKATADK